MLGWIQAAMQQNTIIISVAYLVQKLLNIASYDLI